MADELKPGGPAPWLQAGVAPPDSSEAEIEALARTCETLSGFQSLLGYEEADGFLTALAALPQAPATEAWLAALCGDAFERAFADPESAAAARQSLERRLAVLQAQLEPGAMLDDPDALRLAPLMAEYTEADHRELRERGVAEAELPLFQPGVAWAEGFFQAVDRFEALWTPPAGDEPREAFERAFDQVHALRLKPDDPDWAAHLAAWWPERAPTRDDLITEACYAVQDLRLFWVDYAPVTAPRKAEATPGRNDPCPCGSGKKYKKCHGAAA